MAEVMSPDAMGTDLSRPYTLGTFKDKLDQFDELIKEITLQDLEATPEERRQIIAENLRFDQFCDSIRALFGADVRSTDLKAIYRKISTNPDAKVDWSELFGYFQTETEEQEVTVGEEVNVFTISARRRAGEAAGDRRRRDIIVNIKYVSFLDCYLTASQKGVLCVWTSKFRLQACIDLNESAWLTGCDFLPVQRRVVACTERSLCIWDSRAKGNKQSVLTIKPIEHSPQCLAWVPYPTKYTNEDVFVYGDDQGFLNMVTISPKDFTPKNSKDSRYTSEQALDPNKLTYPIKRRKLHDDWILKVKWFPELNCFGTCSPSSNTSFVLEELDRLHDENDIRGVSISKGVNAFDYCARANIIATGGVDKVIRVWHPHIFSRPTGKLVGHLFTIVDVVMNEKDQHIISLSTARVIRIWDIHTLTSLQVFTDNEERPGEKRIYSMLFNDKHEQLLTGSSVLDVWPLTRAIQDTMQVPHTHDRPISQILYNQEVNQVITICTESVIRVWEAETGKPVYNIQEAHGPNVEVTALCVDKSGYRMATGASDGSIKIWDFGSGQQIKNKMGRGTDDDFAIYGLQYCSVDGSRVLIVQGWKNKLKMLRDSTETSDLPLVREFNDVHYIAKELSFHPSTPKSNHTQKSPLPEIGGSKRGSAQVNNAFRKNYLLASHDLSCLAAYLPDLLATGCNDGSVIFWQIHKSAVEKILDLPGEENISPGTVSREKTKSTALTKFSRAVSQDASSRVNTLKFLVHKVRRYDPEYIKRLAAKAETNDGSDEEDSSTYRRRSKHTSRGPSQSNHSPSRRTSARSGDGTVITIDQTLMDDLTAKIEGDDVVQKSDQKDAEQPNESNDDRGGSPSKNVPTATEAATTGNAEADADDVAVAEKADDTNKPVFDEDDPDSRILVDTYDPVLVTCHQDSFIRFWNLQGDFIKEITAVTRRQASAVTAMCTDPDCHVLITGDIKGYITYWDLADFLKNPEVDDVDLIKQVTCWRAHLTKISQLEYMPSHKAILSGSSDGSVRVWWGQNGRYIGFIGQPRPFNFPSADDTSPGTILPYDITEGPLAPIKTSSAKQTPRAQKFEYPLVFDNEKWRPFRRSAHTARRSEPEEPTDKKFFEALIKPKPFNKCLDGMSTGDMKHGAVFRALPVYRVRTPTLPKQPDYTRTKDEDDVPFTSTIMMNTQPQKTTKPTGKAATEKKKTRSKNMNSLYSSQATISSRSETSTTVMKASPRRR